MTALQPSNVRWVFLHTEGSGKVGRYGTVASMRDWHVRHNGWNDIGYHWVVDRSGALHPGRDLRYAGAHVEGVNANSVGICVAGDGDLMPWTTEQKRAAVQIAAEMCRRYRLRWDAVLGHLEVNRLVSRGLAPKRTAKTCPGRLVNLIDLRAAVKVALGQ